VVNYLPLLEPTLNEVSDRQRAERVVALYFCVRIEVRGSATRLALPSVVTQNQKIALSIHLKAGSGGSH
jgi:hypothetical protein